MSWFIIVILVFIVLNLWCHLGLYQMLHHNNRSTFQIEDGIEKIKKHLGLTS